MNIRRIAFEIASRISAPLTDYVDLSDFKGLNDIENIKVNPPESKPFERFFEFFDLPVTVIKMPKFFKNAESYRRVQGQVGAFTDPNSINIVWTSLGDVSPEWMVHDFWHSYLDETDEGSAELRDPEFTARIREAVESDFGPEMVEILDGKDLISALDLVPLFIEERYRKSLPSTSYNVYGLGNPEASMVGTIVDMAADLMVLHFIKTGSYQPFKLSYSHNIFIDDDGRLHSKKSTSDQPIPCKNPSLPALNKVINQGLKEHFDRASQFLSTKIGEVIEV